MTREQKNTSIQQFHQKIVNQLVNELQNYQSKQIYSTVSRNKVRQHQYDGFSYQKHSPQTENTPQQFTSASIGQFLYDVLQLENSSIDFIMRYIFQSDKRSFWNMQQILKIVLDVQFVITVNNFIVSKCEAQNKTKIKEDQISFLKIQPKELVQNIYESCFFIKNSSNTIPKTLIEQIVEQINLQNGKKGYILLLEYKNFMFLNMIDKHNARKFLTPKKTKNLSPQPTTRQKYQNSQSIREVDEQSEAMGNSNRNLDSVQFKLKGTKLDQQSKLTVSNKQLSSKNLQNNESCSQIQKANLKQKANITQSQRYNFHQILWKSIRAQIFKDDFAEDLDHNQILCRIKSLLEQKFDALGYKTVQRLRRKLQLYAVHKSGQYSNLMISVLIRLVGQQGFKTYHDKSSKMAQNRTKFYLLEDDIKQIVRNSYIKLISADNSEQLIQRIAISIMTQTQNIASSNIVSKPSNSALAQNKHPESRNMVSFKDFLVYVQKLSTPIQIFK